MSCYYGKWNDEKRSKVAYTGELKSANPLDEIAYSLAKLHPDINHYG